jgi:hypothetical protein
MLWPGSGFAGNGYFSPSRSRGPAVSVPSIVIVMVVVFPIARWLHVMLHRKIAQIEC